MKKIGNWTHPFFKEIWDKYKCTICKTILFVPIGVSVTDCPNKDICHHKLKIQSK